MNVIDMLRAHGIEPKRASSSKGGEYHSACPGCGDTSKPDSDRFHVWPGQNDGAGSYWCRGCGKGGDVIQFLIDFDGKSFRAAAEACGKDMPLIPSEHPRRSASEWTPNDISGPVLENSAVYTEKLRKFVLWSNDQLLKTPSQLAFLEKRGIGIDTVKRFLLGWNPGENGKKAIFRPRVAWGLPREMKGGKERRLWIPRGIVVPCLVDDQIVRARIRRPTEDLSEEFGQRYFVVPGGRMDRMMTWPNEGGCEEQRQRGRKSEETAWVIVETELDATMIHQAAGDICGVIALGTSHAKPDPECHAVLKDSMCILNALDFDQAGAGAWRWWEAHYGQVERWPVPEGKDPGEAFEKGVDIRGWVAAGLPVGAMVVKSRRPEERVRGPEVMSPAAEVGAPAPVESTVDGIKELAGLLAKHPVTIENTPRRLRIIEPERWARNNKETGLRISRLVFGCKEVLAHITANRHEIITGRNYYDVTA